MRYAPFIQYPGAQVHGGLREWPRVRLQRRASARSTKLKGTAFPSVFIYVFVQQPQVSARSGSVEKRSINQIGKIITDV